MALLTLQCGVTVEEMCSCSGNQREACRLGGGGGEFKGIHSNSPLDFIHCLAIHFKSPAMEEHAKYVCK